MMFNKQKNLILNLKILKLLFFSPLLISIPFYFANSDAKAGLEFQWDQNSGYRKLKWFQKEDRRKFRNALASITSQNGLIGHLTRDGSTGEASKPYVYVQVVNGKWEVVHDPSS